VEIRASLLRLTRFVAAFEIYNPNVVLRTSEVLSEFRVLSSERTLYSGKAVVSSIVNAGTMLVCEANSTSPANLGAFVGADSLRLADGFQAFLGEWQKVYQVLPEFKVVVADMQTFLPTCGCGLTKWNWKSGARRRATGWKWSAAPRRSSARRSCLHSTRCTNGSRRCPTDRAGTPARAPDVFQKAVASVDALLAVRVPHFSKAARYAGDYEMVDMILRDPHEGDRFLRRWSTCGFSASGRRAHRNRIAYLKDDWWKKVCAARGGESRSEF